ncbi:MAG: hypothetical protein LW629_10760 [Burkholderiales bacterium]|jgi:hypothetical protein|nr:hypothetical protein [Burkholderiales bacterium]
MLSRVLTLAFVLVLTPAVGAKFTNAYQTLGEKISEKVEMAIPTGKLL